MLQKDSDFIADNQLGWERHETERLGESCCWNVKYDMKEAGKAEAKNTGKQASNTGGVNGYRSQESLAC